MNVPRSHSPVYTLMVTTILRFLEQQNPWDAEKLLFASGDLFAITFFRQIFIARQRESCRLWNSRGQGKEGDDYRRAGAGLIKMR